MSKEEQKNKAMPVKMKLGLEGVRDR